MLYVQLFEMIVYKPNKLYRDIQENDRIRNEYTGYCYVHLMQFRLCFLLIVNHFQDHGYIQKYHSNHTNNCHAIQYANFLIHVRECDSHFRYATQSSFLDFDVEMPPNISVYNKS